MVDTASTGKNCAVGLSYFSDGKAYVQSDWTTLLQSARHDVWGGSGLSRTVHIANVDVQRGWDAASSRVLLADGRTTSSVQPYAVGHDAD